MAQTSSEEGGRINQRNQGETMAVPVNFRHHDLIDHFDSAITIDQNELISLWNGIHFMGGNVYVQLRHSRYHEDFLIEACPLPVSNNVMSCQWPEESLRYTEDAGIVNAILADGLSLYLLRVCLQVLEKNFFTFEMPGCGYVLGRRQTRHYRCRNINVELLQNGFCARGDLKDFCASAFAVKVSPEGANSFHHFDADCLSMVNLYRAGEIIFSSSCLCVRQTSELIGREIVFAPAAAPVSRLLKKKFRMPRVCVSPLPNVTFNHPLTGKPVQLDVKNISSSGFAVLLAAEEDVLMIRMVIPELTINFAGALKIKCRAQVLNRHVGKNGKIRYGLVILNMDILTYNRLSHIVMNTLDPGIHIADTIDADQIWDLFFATGFIYARKYESLQSYRKPLKETYRKLYQENPAIFTQVTYQQNGRVYGHVSMLRSYERTWMVQHLAARPLDDMRTGLQILKQVIRYFDSLYCLPAVGMDFMMFYFRPENHFPDRYFGDFARYLNNPRACSLDLFSYLHYPRSAPEIPLPKEWSMGPCTVRDLEELSRFYQAVSGGLLLDILRLNQEGSAGDDLTDLYAQCGFKRSVQALALRQNNQIKAVLIVNRSDSGLNLSDFLNGIKILVIDTPGLPWQILSAAVSRLSFDDAMDRIPLLIYPADYLKAQNIPCEKSYNLWIMDLNHGREYVEYRYKRRKTIN